MTLAESRKLWRTQMRASQEQSNPLAQTRKLVHFSRLDDSGVELSESWRTNRGEDPDTIGEYRPSPPPRSRHYPYPPYFKGQGRPDERFVDDSMESSGGEFEEMMWMELTEQDALQSLHPLQLIPDELWEGDIETERIRAAERLRIVKMLEEEERLRRNSEVFRMRANRAQYMSDMIVMAFRQARNIRPSAVSLFQRRELIRRGHYLRIYLGPSIRSRTWRYTVRGEWIPTGERRLENFYRRKTHQFGMIGPPVQQEKVRERSFALRSNPFQQFERPDVGTSPGMRRRSQRRQQEVISPESKPVEAQRKISSKDAGEESELPADVATKHDAERELTGEDVGQRELEEQLAQREQPLTPTSTPVRETEESSQQLSRSRSGRLEDNQREFKSDSEKTRRTASNELKQSREGDSKMIHVPISSKSKSNSKPLSRSGSAAGKDTVISSMTKMHVKAMRKESGAVAQRIKAFESGQLYRKGKETGPVPALESGEIRASAAATSSQNEENSSSQRRSNSPQKSTSPQQSTSPQKSPSPQQATSPPTSTSPQRSKQDTSPPKSNSPQSSASPRPSSPNASNRDTLKETEKPEEITTEASPRSADSLPRVALQHVKHKQGKQEAEQEESRDKDSTIAEEHRDTRSDSPANL